MTKKNNSYDHDVKLQSKGDEGEGVRNLWFLDDIVYGWTLIIDIFDDKIEPTYLKGNKDCEMFRT